MVIGTLKFVTAKLHSEQIKTQYGFDDYITVRLNAFSILMGS
jgi:hypothetical protein